MLLEDWADISARNLASGCELKVLDDFLDFAEHHFSQVGPYSTLRRASKSFKRIECRLDVMIAEALGVAKRTVTNTGPSICPSTRRETSAASRWHS